MTESRISFAAVLLAGGRSRRMGRDKAFLPWGPANDPLWRVQVDKLQALDPAQLLISANADQDFGADFLVLRDAASDLGPLSGLLACLEAADSPLVLVLAVDMPFVTGDLLRDLVRAANDDCGFVYESGGFFEPFPGLYPKALASLARECLESGNDSMQAFIRAAAANGKITSAPCPPRHSGLFKSINSPEDLP